MREWDYRRAPNLPPRVLDSIETVTNLARDVLERRAFDPFGRHLANWGTDSTLDGTGATIKGLFSAVTTRGFTGHDHIDSVGLNHMNGRMYDPALGRFTGVDPFMTGPLNALTLNPYSYVSNNPIMGTDPSGYAEQTTTPCGGQQEECTPPPPPPPCDPEKEECDGDEGEKDVASTCRGYIAAGLYCVITLGSGQKLRLFRMQWRRRSGRERGTLEAEVHSKVSESLEHSLQMRQKRALAATKWRHCLAQ